MEHERASTKTESDDKNTLKVPPAQTTPSEWSVADVCEWLKSHNLSRYADAFSSFEVDGLTLLEIIDDADLVELDVTVRVHRRKILTLVRLLRNTDDSTVQEASSENQDHIDQDKNSGNEIEALPREDDMLESAYAREMDFLAPRLSPVTNGSDADGKTTHSDKLKLPVETSSENVETVFFNAEGEDHQTVLLRDDILEREWKNLSDLERERDQYKRAFMLECVEKHQTTIESERALMELEKSAQRHAEYLQGQLNDVSERLSKSRADCDKLRQEICTLNTRNKKMKQKLIKYKAVSQEKAYSGSTGAIAELREELGRQREAFQVLNMKWKLAEEMKEFLSSKWIESDAEIKRLSDEVVWAASKKAKAFEHLAHVDQLIRLLSRRMKSRPGDSSLELAVKDEWQRLLDSHVFSLFFHRDGRARSINLLDEYESNEITASDSDGDKGIAERNSDKDHNLSSDSDGEIEASLDPPLGFHDDAIKAAVVIEIQKSGKVAETNISTAKIENAPNLVSLTSEHIKTLPQ